MKNKIKLLLSLLFTAVAFPAHAVEYITNTTPKIQATYNTDTQVLIAAISNDFGSQFYITMSDVIGTENGVHLIVDTRTNTISAYSYDGFNQKDGIYLGSATGQIYDGCNNCNGSQTPWIYAKEFGISLNLTEINAKATELGVANFEMGQNTFVQVGNVYGTIQYENPNCVPGRYGQICGEITNYDSLDIPFWSSHLYVDYNTAVVGGTGGGTGVSEPSSLAMLMTGMMSLMFLRNKNKKS